MWSSDSSHLFCDRSKTSFWFRRDQNRNIKLEIAKSIALPKKIRGIFDFDRDYFDNKGVCVRHFTLDLVESHT